MTDLALIWDADAWCADLLMQDGGLATDEGMRSAILISLFSDARAPDGAELPEAGADRGGWWGDAFPYPIDGTGDDDAGRNALGSLLWLLGRSKVTANAVRDARQYALDALAWFKRDGVAKSVDVEVEAQGERLALGVILERPSGPGRQRFDFVWEASAS